MLKGVNKQVVEIVQADSEYFEKALFFVKPQYSAMSEAKLREQAKQAVDFSCAPPVTKQKKDKSDFLLGFAKFVASASIGALICALILYI